MLRFRSLPRLALTALLLAASAVLQAPAAAADETARFNPADRAAIEQIVRDYLMRHPELVLEALQTLEEKHQAETQAETRAAIEARRAAIFEDADDFTYGNPKGDVTIVEFFDYTCGHCKRSFQPLMDFVDADGNIRLILKEFPILGPRALDAAKAALAARKQGRYLEMHRALFEHEGQLTEKALMEIAAKAGLDGPKLKKDMEDPKLMDIFSRHYALAEALGIEGTPAFIIGGEMLPGAVDKERLTRVVAEAREGR
ncbi:MAG: DsbA family protein [Parvibaculum sp.]|uniref:DsbA family protein n=1 Tax=Parvibaculum sp. TaxID=2024848 RepID=UPI0027247106|nr:DsbA family protein [Parvibaculum sp.]MDO8838197.1 DsbA family protein [Parvibaculum sp.]